MNDEAANSKFHRGRRRKTRLLAGGGRHLTPNSYDQTGVVSPFFSQ